MDASDPLRVAEVALAHRRFHDVVQLCRPHLAHPQPATRARALRLVGEATLALGALPTALQTVQAALQLAPSSAPTWHLAGRLFKAAGSATSAEQALTRATQLDPSLSAAWLQLAELLVDGGDLARAAEVLQRGVLRNPARVDLTERLLEVLYALGALRVLNRAVDSALQRFPRHAGVRFSAARARYLSGDVPDAMAHLDAALDADPGHVAARALRAEYRTRSRDDAGALEDAEHVLTTHPSDCHARLVRARIRTKHNDLDGAHTDLDHIIDAADRVPPDALGRAYVQRGLVREAQQRFPEAYSDLAAGQASLARAAMARAADADGFLRDVARRMDRLAAEAPVWSEVGGWPTSVPEGWPLAGAPPVFIFGFPRSGTTLVEHILGAHPQLAATDERNVLGAVLARVDRDLGGKDPARLTDAEVVSLRTAYADSARRWVPDGRRVIDKIPLNIVHTALVRRVFPDAPILVMLRDPRDCVWSAFVQAFSPNAAMMNTTSLEGTARLYATTMAVWLRARALPGLRFTELKYEDIVADVQVGARALVAATGLPWHDDVADYRAHLARQTVRTPSFAAIAKPVTTTRIGRWRHFPDAMAPILPTLAPFVAAFGYPEARG